MHFHFIWKKCMSFFLSLLFFLMPLRGLIFMFCLCLLYANKRCFSVCAFFIYSFFYDSVYIFHSLSSCSCVCTHFINMFLLFAISFYIYIQYIQIHTYIIICKNVLNFKSYDSIKFLAMDIMFLMKGLCICRLFMCLLEYYK